MPLCYDVFNTVLDALLSILTAAMTLFNTSLSQPPRHFFDVPDRALYASVSFRDAQDTTTVIARLRAADPASRAAAACELQRLGSGAQSAIAALIARLDDTSPVDPKICGEDRHYWTKEIDRQTTPGEEAAAALVAIGTASLQPLVAATRAPQWVARRNAVWALGALDDSRGIAPALTTLKDSEPPVRATSAWALGALDANEAVPALIAALKDEDASVRSQVAWALGSIGDRRAVDALVVALKDSVEAVRSQVAWALGSLGDRRATSALTEALKDSSPRVRRQAAWALGSIGR